MPLPYPQTVSLATSVVGRTSRAKKSPPAVASKNAPHHLKTVYILCEDECILLFERDVMEELIVKFLLLDPASIDK